MLENARGKSCLAKIQWPPAVRFLVPAFANEQQSQIRRTLHPGSVSHPSPNPPINPSGAPGAIIGPVRARALALETGFTEAGLVSLPYPDTERDAERFAGWIGAGRAATMRYLQRVAEDGRLIRARVQTPFPWARSAIVCFASYGSHSEPLSIDETVEHQDSLTGLADQPVHSTTQEEGPSFSASANSPHLSSKELNPRSGWIARYAWSSRVDPSGKRVASDYHKVLLKRLKALESRLHEEFGTFESRAYVDTGPVVERSLAVAAGLGWTGKNTCLIHPILGSFGFLAVLLTSLKSSPKRQTPEVPDRCGSCTRCIQACPTHALATPYQMDANRCIAYLTIEHKGPIDESLMPGIGRQVFGCDICQDVCPWNSKSRRSGPIVIDPDLSPRPELINPTLDWMASLDEQSFERLFNGSPVRRTGFNGLRRNIAIAMGNSGDSRFIQWLANLADAADEGLRSAARWALHRLRALG